jgi:molybdenum cofactor biosynthesis enzyme MoaA
MQTIICIGNGSEFANALAQDIATSYNFKHHGFLDRHTEILPGCYHTSIYDIKLQELSDKLKSLDQLKIVVLPQDQSYYNNEREYYDTIDLAEALALEYNVEFVEASMSNPFRHLLEQNKSFCILPFISLNLMLDKNTKHCCYMETTNSNYTNFVTDSTSQQIRQQLLDGKKISDCIKCYKIEEYGGRSPRQTYTVDWTHRLGLTSYEDVIKKTKLVRYDIMMGNYCNLQCRMCSPGSSSLIDTEYFQLGLSSSLVGLKSENIFDTVDLDSVQQVLVAGGEPSINQDFYNFLKRCIQAKKTDFEISIASNAVSLPKEFVSLIQQFSNIKISVSLDGFGETNRYIRWPSDWEKIKQNIQRLKDTLSPHNYYFNTTVSIYNISQLYELFEFLDTSYPTSAYNINLLTYPTMQQPWNFPNKKIALDNLNKIKTLKKYQNDEIFNNNINSIIQRIETCEVDLEQLSNFFKFNDILDQSRNVQLTNFIPELEHCRSYLIANNG